MQLPVIFLIGPPQHGKTTARKIVCRLTGLRGASCSDVIYAFLAERNKTTVEELKKMDKEVLRPKLVEVGDWMCGEIGKLKDPQPETDNEWWQIPSSIVRLLYQNGVNVIDGARRSLELDQSRQHLQWNGVRSLVIWVEKTNGPQIKDSTTVTKEQADEVVHNDGDEKELETLLEVLLKRPFPPPKPLSVPVILDALGGVAGSEKKIVLPNG